VLADSFGIKPMPEEISASPSSYTAAHVLGGADLVMTEDDMPMIRGHPLNSAEDVRKLTMPECYLEHPAMAPYVEQYRWLVDRAGASMAVGLSPGTQGPVTTAKLLRGQDFFVDLLEHPDEAHRLLEFVTDSTIRFWREVRQFTGQPLQGGAVAVGDDFAGLMSPRLFEEFAVPCYMRIYEAFKADIRLHHTELVRPAHLRYLSAMQVDYLNLGEDQYLTPRDVAAATDVPFEWHVKTATVAHGTPEMVRSEYVDAIRDGAPAMITELCARRMPFDNIRAFIDIAQHHGPMVEAGGVYDAAMKADELRRQTGLKRAQLHTSAGKAFDAGVLDPPALQTKG